MMVKPGEVRSLLREKFNYGNVRYTGTNAIWRGWDKKMRQAIPTGVTHSPLDATQVKEQAIRAKLKEVHALLSQHGGREDLTANTLVRVKFNPGTKKEFTVTLALSQYPSYPRASGQDSAYQSSWIDVSFSNKE